MFMTTKVGAVLLRKWDPLRVGGREGGFSLKWAVGFWVFLGLTQPAWASTSYAYFLITFFAWWGVSLPLALSGLRRGDVRNRICAGISVAIFILLAYLLVRFE